ncbi:MAG: hypothetical protein ACYDHN_06530 [Solirubrobacteraceae bacterium]
MEPVSAGELVKVAGDGPQLDGVVFDTPSRSKVIVAVMDAKKGPVFRTVHPKVLTERAEAGSDDRALQLLIRRTPTSTRGSAGGANASARGHAGHTRTAAHRTTGK